MTRDRRRRAVAIAVGVIGAALPVRLLACPICFQFDPSPVTSGVLAAVFVLVGVTVSVLGTVGVFVRRLAINDAAAARTPELLQPREPSEASEP